MSVIPVSSQLPSGICAIASAGEVGPVASSRESGESCLAGCVHPSLLGGLFRVWGVVLAVCACL